MIDKDISCRAVPSDGHMMKLPIVKSGHERCAKLEKSGHERCAKSIGCEMLQSSMYHDLEPRTRMVDPRSKVSFFADVQTAPKSAPNLEGL